MTAYLRRGSVWGSVDAAIELRRDGCLAGLVRLFVLILAVFFKFAPFDSCFSFGVADRLAVFETVKPLADPLLALGRRHHDCRQF